MTPRYEILRVAAVEQLERHKGALVRQMMDFIRRSRTEANSLASNLQTVYASVMSGREDAAVWIVLRFTEGPETEELAGYAVASLIPDAAGGTECFIWQAYLDKPGALAQGYAAILEWARAAECAAINFTTRRDPKAYRRLVRKLGFEPTTTEFEVRL